MSGVGDFVPLVLIPALLLIFVCGLCWCCEEPANADQRESLVLEQRAARALAAQAALAARAVVVLAEQAAAARPYFPYLAHGGRASETLECAICLEPLRQGQHCSEVPACRHVFHRDCLGVWARSNGSCPLCREKIVPGPDGVAVAEDMV